ncbi:MAG: hypothetical protein CSYNP_01452 [Syntrophus sp. SKADARSKE-3]|nr:hypothetical protein [Syntrophus sp. SKADARSKE-3]
MSGAWPWFASADQGSRETFGRLLKNAHLLRSTASLVTRSTSMYVFPILNQSAIFVVFVIGSSMYFSIHLRRLFLAALISSLI